MSSFQSFDPYDERRSSNIFRHAGFRVGMVGGVIMIGVHLVLLLINEGENRGDWLAWLLQLLVYIFASRVAAEQHHSAQQDDLEHLRGVQGAGVGAALVTSAIVWGFIILRGVFRDALGMFIVVEPISLFIMIVLDVLLALGLGAWGGRAVAKKYESFSGW